MRTCMLPLLFPKLLLILFVILASQIILMQLIPANTFNLILIILFIILFELVFHSMTVIMTMTMTTALVAMLVLVMLLVAVVVGVTGATFLSTAFRLTVIVVCVGVGV